jgi:serine/threonine-protein kinase
MSPEQVEGKPVDPRTDIYSFGVTCYHLLTGQPPFKGTNAFDVAIQHVQKQPVPLAQIRPDLPADLCTLVHRMMAKNPDDRIQTGREIVREVARIRDTMVGAATNGAEGSLGNSSTGHQSYILQMGPSQASPAFGATLTQMMPRPSTSSSHLLPWLAFGSVVVALAGGLAYGWWQNRDNNHVAVAPPTTASLPPPAPPGMNAEEKRLLDAIKLMESSHKDNIALEFRIELGLYYLKDLRLDDAEATFKPLEDSDKAKNEYRHNVGLLGKAMVLAFRDRPKESNDIFTVVLASPTTGVKKGMDPGKKDAVTIQKQSPIQNLLNSRPDLWEMVSKALIHNQLNSPSTFPSGGVLRKYAVPPKPYVPPKG